MMKRDCNDWDVRARNDWAPMPFLQDATPSQGSEKEEEEEEDQVEEARDEEDEEEDEDDSSDDESSFGIVPGIVVDTQAPTGRVYVGATESLTASVTTVGEDGTISTLGDRYGTPVNNKSSSGAGGRRKPLDRVDEERHDGTSTLDQSREEEYEEVQPGGAVPLGLSSKNDPSAQSASDHQFQNKVSELANVAGASAVEAGVQLSSFFKKGWQMGMSGVTKHLESMEEVVQKQFEGGSGNRQRMTAATSASPSPRPRGRTMIPFVEAFMEGRDCMPEQQAIEREIEEEQRDQQKEEKEHRSRSASKNPSSDDSTVSSMGDTFHEYIKPRIEMSKKEARAAASRHEKATKKDKSVELDSPRVRIMAGKKDKLASAGKQKSTPTAAAEKKNFGVSTLFTRKQTSKATAKKDSKEQVFVISTNARGRQQTRSTDNRARSKSQPRGKRSNTANNNTAKTATHARSKSRPREDRPRSRSKSRPRQQERAHQDPIISSSTGKKQQVVVAATKKAESSKKQAPLTWSKTVEKKQAASGRSSRDSKNSRDSPVNINGIEMVPFTSNPGNAGLLIIDGAECALSATPKGIRSTLEGRPKAPTRSKSKTTTTKIVAAEKTSSSSGRTKSSTKKESSNSNKKNKSLLTRWGTTTKQAPSPVPTTTTTGTTPNTTTKIRTAAIKAAATAKSPRNQEAATPSSSSTPTMPIAPAAVAYRKTRPLGSVSEDVGVTPHDFHEMLDAITKFKLTAQKLGVDKADLLQAMSFATQDDDGYVAAE